MKKTTANKPSRTEEKMKYNTLKYFRLLGLSDKARETPAPEKPFTRITCLTD